MAAVLRAKDIKLTHVGTLAQLHGFDKSPSPEYKAPVKTRGRVLRGRKMKFKLLCVLVAVAASVTHARADADEDYLKKAREFLEQQKKLNRWDCPESQDTWTHEPEGSGSEADRTGSRIGKCTVQAQPGSDVGRALLSVQKGLLDAAILNVEQVVRPSIPSIVDEIQGVGQQFIVKYTRTPNDYVVFDTLLEIATNEKDRLVYRRMGLKTNGKGMSDYIERIIGYMDLKQTAKPGVFEATFKNSVVLESIPWIVPDRVVKNATIETIRKGRDKILYMVLKNM